MPFRGPWSAKKATSRWRSGDNLLRIWTISTAANLLFWPAALRRSFSAFSLRGHRCRIWGHTDLGTHCFQKGGWIGMQIVKSEWRIYFCSTSEVKKTVKLHKNQFDEEEEGTWEGRKCMCDKRLSLLSSLSSCISPAVFFVLADVWLTASFLPSSASSFRLPPPPPMTRGGKLQGRESPGPGSRLAGASYPVIYPGQTHPRFVSGCEGLSVKTGWRIIELLAPSCIKVSYEWEMMMVMVVAVDTKDALREIMCRSWVSSPQIAIISSPERRWTIENCENNGETGQRHLWSWLLYAF